MKLAYEDWSDATPVDLETRDRWIQEAIERVIRDNECITFTSSGDTLILVTFYDGKIEVMDAQIRRVSK